MLDERERPPLRDGGLSEMSSAGCLDNSENSPPRQNLQIKFQDSAEFDAEIALALTASGLRAAAHMWAERGFAVFPLKPRDKVPLGSLVPHGLKEATRDHAVICDWWQREPKANISGGNFVIDLDGPDAAAWFGNACGQHGGAKTLTARTSRGFHVFFACGAKVPNSAGRIAPGVDVRGEGGYVVAAPSVHPSGFVYTIARDLPIAAAPRWLIDAALPEERPAPAPGPMPAYGYAPSAWRCEDAKLRAIPGILSLVANARQGERNRITFWAACRFSEMVRDGLITQRLAEELLLHGASRCGLSGMEILTTARSAWRRA